ncbi:Por secretion system C-terminal sorting domain-containing protein [Pustulibacterium marinum]|uniref:Por secretion system C-terminal sorting domain-containing protein n=1 Tax=Pustulibacterium marinum TaxID=1224947 RepID=A0A1I7GV45_9FLAO|nr:T9SS type A sorting domain-containing protein [Pustulibacterium marinum]SFU52310.1 Por secretion system C-terminal sorting domain-containing protein [Pustulibacterium marinum]
MIRKLFFFVLSTIFFNLNAQVQISNFTYNSVEVSNPAYLQEFNNKIFFPAGNDGSGRELWSSDGTSLNTNLVIDIEPGETNGLTTFFSTELNNELFFTAKVDNNYTGGGEIWKTNGTEEGSSFVTTFDGRLYGMTTVGNEFFMTIKTGENTLQIWKSDGTDSGTILVKDNISLWSTPSFQGSVNNSFIFTIQVPSTNNVKVWRSDGTDIGTFPLTGEMDGNGSMSTNELSQYIHYNNKLYFITRSFLYETDGTLNGTNNIASVWNAQYDLANFGDAIELNGKMYFSFFSSDLKKLSIYESDGTTSGTSEIYTVTNNQYFYPSYLNTLGNNLIFSSVNSNNGTSLFYLDSDTNLVTEILEVDQAPQQPPAFLGNYSALSLDNINDNLFFVSSPKDTWPQRKGWILDINSLTLDPVEALDNIVHGAFGRKLIYNNDLYYSKNAQLWKLDSNTLNINSINKIESIHLYPNPVSDFVYFSSQNYISQAKIYDMNGKLVLEKNINSINKINIAGLNPGVYIIKFIGRNGDMTYKKFVKK